jgi:hypothetical protein
VGSRSGVGFYADFLKEMIADGVNRFVCLQVVAGQRDHPDA